MLDALRKDWRLIKGGETGHRFQNVHDQHQQGGRSRWSRPIWLALGGILVVLGPIAGLVPGPGGIVVFLLGAVILAKELRPAARALDWCELHVRKAWKSVRHAWRQGLSRS